MWYRSTRDKALSQESLDLETQCEDDPMGVVDEQQTALHLNSQPTDSDKSPASSGVISLDMQSQLGNCKSIYFATLHFGSTN